MGEYHRAACRLLVVLIATGVVQVPEVPHPPLAHSVVHRPDHSHAGHHFFHTHPENERLPSPPPPPDFLPFQQDTQWDWYQGDGQDAAFVAMLESGMHQRNAALLTLLTPKAA